MIIKFIILLLLAVYLNAQTYTLYISSTKYTDVAKKYYFELKRIFPNEDLLIRTHEKPNFSLIIRNIENIEKAKELQNILSTQTTYKNSYIKKYAIEPEYNIVKVKDDIQKEQTTINTKEEENSLEEYAPTIENTNKYITAATMYNTKQYQKSYEMFYELFLENNYNININYFLGKSAFNLEKYDEATAAFERVLIQKPDFNQARYDYARILYKLKQNEEAKKEFEKLLESEITTETKEEIKKYLSILNKKNEKKKVVAKVMLGVSRSSNVNNGLNSSEYRLPGFNDILVQGEKPIADSAHSEMLNINFFNYFEKQPVRIQNSFLAYNKKFFNEKDQNINVFSYQPSLDYFDANNKHMYSLELSADKIYRGNDEDFSAYSISPKFSTKDINTYLKYQKIIYNKNIDEDKNFEKIQFFTKLNLFENMNYYTNIYKNMSINDLRTDIDKYTVGNGINLFYNITEDNKINLNYQFDYSKYKYRNVFFNSKRKDESHLIDLSLMHNFDKTSILNISTSYYKNNSNQDAYVYDEKIISLKYLKAFSW
jgi:hypothetical protein